MSLHTWTSWDASTSSPTWSTGSGTTRSSSGAITSRSRIGAARLDTRQDRRRRPRNSSHRPHPLHFLASVVVQATTRGRRRPFLTSSPVDLWIITKGPIHLGALSCTSLGAKKCWNREQGTGNRETYCDPLSPNRQKVPTTSTDANS